MEDKKRKVNFVSMQERPGALELCYVFTPTGDPGAEATASYSTPSMWAVADEWSDGLLARSYDERTGRFERTREWVRVKMIDAIGLQVAMACGLMREGEVTLERIAEMNNLYRIETIDDAEAAEADASGHLPLPEGESPEA